jgi:hypothetical protein
MSMKFNYLFIKSRKYFRGLIIAPLFFFWNTGCKGPAEIVISENLMFKFDAVNPNTGEKNILEGNVTNCYYGNDRMLIDHIITDTSSVVFDTLGNMVYENPAPPYITYRYFVYNESNRFGLMYDSLSQTTGILFNVDSLQKKKLFKGANFYSTGNSVINTESNLDRKLITEKCIPKNKADATYPDTSLFIFSYAQKKEAYYSFADSASLHRNKRLVKVLFIYNPQKAAENHVAVPRREMLFELSGFKRNYDKSILKLFKNYQNDSRMAENKL